MAGNGLGTGVGAADRMKPYHEVWLHLRLISVTVALFCVVVALHSLHVLPTAKGSQPPPVTVATVANWIAHLVMALGLFRFKPWARLALGRSLLMIAAWFGVGMALRLVHPVVGVTTVLLLLILIRTLFSAAAATLTAHSGDLEGIDAAFEPSDAQGHGMPNSAKA